MKIIQLYTFFVAGHLLSSITCEKICHSLDTEKCECKQHENRILLNGPKMEGAEKIMCLSHLTRDCCKGNMDGRIIRDMCLPCSRSFFNLKIGDTCSNDLECSSYLCREKICTEEPTKRQLQIE
jgi:hypothetical protein